MSRRGLLRGATAAGAGLVAGQLSARAEPAGAGAVPEAAPSNSQANQPVEYSLWYLEYANVPTFPVSGLLYGAHNRGTIRIPFGYVVIKGMGITALFDVGFRGEGRGAELGRAFGAQDWESPETVLAKIGMQPADIQHIFIGHEHFDHMDNLPAFPNAHVYVQEREISAWLNAMQFPKPQLAWVTGAMNPQDLLDAVQLSLAGRLTLVDGEMLNAMPGISIYPAHDTHTFGSQYVTVATRAGGSARTFVLTSDAIYMYANVEGDEAYGLAKGSYVPLGYAQGNQVTQLEKMHEMVRRGGGDTNNIIPGHDPAIFQRYPSKQVGPNSVAEINLAGGERSRL